MALAPGARLGPYEITARIGAGGMGEVYRAMDTNLKRAVAIKVLPESVAADPDRLARLQREAELLASLNHSSIAQIYGLEKGDGTIALVMELVDGYLRDRSELSLKEALPQLLVAMAERHESVSERKGRQRWLFVEGTALVRDDPRPMGLGFHALRFPQFGSLARDLRLREGDLRDG